MTLIKYPEESRLYAFDFAPQVEIAAGATLATPATVTTTRIEGRGTITVSAVTISGNRVNLRIAGGELNAIHELTCSVATSGGDVVAARGLLLIARV